MTTTQITPALIDLLRTVIYHRDSRLRMDQRGRGRKSERLGVEIEITKAEVAFLVAAGKLPHKDAGINELARQFLNESIAEYEASLPARA